MTCFAWTSLWIPMLYMFLIKFFLSSKDVTIQNKLRILFRKFTHTLYYYVYSWDKLASGVNIYKNHFQSSEWKLLNFHAVPKF